MTARASLPTDRLHFGISNGPGTELDWLAAAGVPWRYRYQYLAGGINTGGAPGDPCGANAGWQTWNSPAGQFVTNYINDSVAHSAIPVFTYYEIVQSNPSAGSESAEPTKISTLCTMQAYWADFTVLMQKIGAYGGPVVVHVEPDFWGFMEQHNPDPTAIPAVVASSGNPDLAGLPNTVAGMGMAFQRLRDLYAPNALLGAHASSWASSVDIASDTRTTVDPNAEADKVAAFITKSGTWDVIFNDVADHDAGYSGIWWDKTNTVFPNFARWLAFMSRIHTDTGLPLVEWQVPVGNQYFDTMNDTDGHYQDNRAEYFLAHPDRLTAAGIVAVLFGKANGGQTTYTDFKNDGVTNPAPISTWQCNLCNNHVSSVSDDDGGYLRMAVGAYYRNAAVTPCTSITVTASPSTVTGGSGTHVTVTPSASGCANPQYEFWLRPASSSTWQMVQAYGAGTTYDWNSVGAAPGTVYLGVHARDLSSRAAYDAVASTPVTVIPCSCGSVAITASPGTVVQNSGAHVTVTATCSACGSVLYEFWLRPASSSTWQMVQAYGTNNVYDWNTTGAAPGTVFLGVHVKAPNSTTAAGYDAVASTPVTVTPSTCASVTISASPTSVVRSTSNGTHVTATATASGCTTSARYEFWIRPASSTTWQLVQAYGTSSSYDWNTTGAAVGTVYIGVHVRDANSTASYDAVASTPVSVT